MNNLILSVENCVSNIEAIKETMDKSCPQDGNSLMEHLNNLASLVGLAAQTIASLQYHNDTEALNAVKIAKDEGYSPAMAKVFISGRCAEIGALYKLSERMGAGLVHVIESVRSTLSYLKQENFASNMQRG